MIRLSIFILGLLMFLAGAASNFERIHLPIDLTSMECKISMVTLTLDVVLMVAGVFLILMAWVFHRLAQ
ncbi:MAG: hypothetical protein KAT30_02845 [Candidatus Krumholzibacteria bacterium]|nr:hypothetical protein [Candidatus Krumholzibacteria bacterium]